MSLTRRRFATRSARLGLALAAPLLMPATLRAQTVAYSDTLSPDEARRDLRVLQRTLEALHPGLYRRATPAALQAAFEQAQQAVAGGASRAQLVLLASRLAALVQCGHTWVSRYNQRADLQQGLLDRLPQPPLALRWAQGRALVHASAAPGVQAGDELLAVDGRPVAELAAALMPLLRADGPRDDKRWAQLDSTATGGAFERLLPLLHPPADGVWRLDVRAAAAGTAAPVRTVQAPGLSPAAHRAALPDEPADWQLRIDGDTGVLTLPTFAFWRSRFDAAGFIARSFEALRDVPYLVIDQRRNEGGDDALGRALLAQLIRRPHTEPAVRSESAYERVPYVLARFLDTWDFGFFDRTGQVTRGAGRNWLLPPRPPVTVQPVAEPYRGRVVALVGPVNSSAGYLFARELQATGAARLVGRRTGGSLRGLNGGQIAWVQLPHSGVGVDVPLLAHFSTAEPEPPDEGVTPDITVPARWDDRVAGVDADMAAARALIARWRSGAAG